MLAYDLAFEAMLHKSLLEPSCVSLRFDRSIKDMEGSGHVSCRQTHSSSRPNDTFNLSTRDSNTSSCDRS